MIQWHEHPFIAFRSRPRHARNQLIRLASRIAAFFTLPRF